MQTPWQFQCILKWGHNGTIFMVTTLGTNNMKFHFTLIVFDECRNGVRIAWIITSQQNEEGFVS
jgi:hypothetical protein